MDAITQLISNPHAKETITYLIVALVAFEFIIKLWDYFKERFGIETANSKREKAQNEAITNLKKEMNELKAAQSSYITTQNKIIEAIDSLKNSFVDKEVDDMRWDILDFANALMAGREYNKEQYNHALAVYSKYTKIIEENGLLNEQVDISMAYVKERYQQCLRTGFLKAVNTEK